jgi:hypothetical protein
MKTLWIGTITVALGLAAALLWPKSEAGAQINAEGCTCSRPSMLTVPGRPDAAVFYCVCPGMQCVITTTAPTAAQPSNVAQSCMSGSAVR